MHVFIWKINEFMLLTDEENNIQPSGISLMFDNCCRILLCIMCCYQCDRGYNGYGYKRLRLTVMIFKFVYFYFNANIKLGVWRLKIYKIIFYGGYNDSVNRLEKLNGY